MKNAFLSLALIGLFLTSGCSSTQRAAGFALANTLSTVGVKQALQQLATTDPKKANKIAAEASIAIGFITSDASVATANAYLPKVDSFFKLPPAIGAEALDDLETELWALKEGCDQFLAGTK